MIVGLAFVALGLSLGAGPAAAHSSLVSSNPAADSVLEQPPTSIELVFNQDISESFATIAVRDGTDAQVEVSAPSVAGPVVTARLPAGLAAGGFTVGYRVVSADGHPITGEFTFTVAAGVTATSAEGVAPAIPGSASATDRPAQDAHRGDDPDGSLESNWIVVVVIIAVVLGLATIGGLLLFSSRRHSDEDPTDRPGTDDGN
ncbi:copper resistance CopC family protein [Williamsia sp. 1135]|uniref:copper resistance CopC family protein n=1 Tax=Williamsia sp. 1135 TaxID=1889262 RepID=UPI00143960B0|nr:copper resistance CopC family protein [Williamsia sp. 1135]